MSLLMMDDFFPSMENNIFVSDPVVACWENFGQGLDLQQPFELHAEEAVLGARHCAEREGPATSKVRSDRRTAGTGLIDGHVWNSSETHGGGFQVYTLVITNNTDLKPTSLNMSGINTRSYDHNDTKVYQPHRRSEMHRRRSRAVGPCTLCGRHAKNPSDARKHGMQHTKPFRCLVDGCGRTDGFATECDLERHKKSVHKLVPAVGNRATYLCAGCTDPEKIWQRKDHFVAHVRRKHRDWDERVLLTASELQMSIPLEGMRWL